jgi:integrase
MLRLNNFRRRSFDPAVAALGLPWLTPHQLRHTAASLAVSAGANVKAVQLMLGHSSASMTLDVYAGLFGDDLDAVADRLDELAAAVGADQMRTKGKSDRRVTPLGKHEKRR